MRIFVCDILFFVIEILLCGNGIDSGVIMASEVREISVNGNRLHGAYAYESFRDYLRTYVSYTRSAQACRERSQRDTTDEVMSICLDDAIACCRRLVDNIVPNVDVTDVDQWAQLADAIACCGRLSVYSGHTYGGLGAVRAVYDVATVIDLFGRLSDEACDLSELDLADSADMRRRAQCICYDLLDGRVGPWLSWARHQLALVTLARDRNLIQVWDTNAQARFLLLSMSVSEELGYSFDETIAEVGHALSMFADDYDRLQMESFIADTGEDGFVPTAEIAGCVHLKTFVLADDMVSAAFPRTSMPAAWCAVSCTSPDSCVGSRSCALGW